VGIETYVTHNKRLLTSYISTSPKACRPRPAVWGLTGPWLHVYASPTDPTGKLNDRTYLLCAGNVRFLVCNFPLCRF